jgi:hypothetical protein
MSTSAFPEFQIVAPANDEPVDQSSQPQNWGSLGGMKWAVGNSIWNDSSVTTTTLAPPQGGDDQLHGFQEEGRRQSLMPENLMPSHQPRKFSLATAQEVDYETLRDEEFSGSYAAPKTRSRSKSSSAIFSPFSNMHSKLSVEQEQPPSIWEGSESGRRRSSTQPGLAFGSMWDPTSQQENNIGMQNDNNLALPTESVGAGVSRDFRMSDRRFSHAPNLHSDLLASEYVFFSFLTP